MTRPNMDESICAECALKLGARWPEGHCATQWTGVCGECGKEKPVCAVSDWLWGKSDKIKLGVWD